MTILREKIRFWDFFWLFPDFFRIFPVFPGKIPMVLCNILQALFPGKNNNFMTIFQYLDQCVNERFLNPWMNQENLHFWKRKKGSLVSDYKLITVYSSYTTIRYQKSMAMGCFLSLSAHLFTSSMNTNYI